MIRIKKSIVGLCLLAALDFLPSCSIDYQNPPNQQKPDVDAGPNSGDPLLEFPIGPPLKRSSLVDFNSALRPGHASEIDAFEHATRYDINMEYKYEDAHDQTNPFSISQYVLNVYQVTKYTNNGLTGLNEVVFRFLANVSAYGKKFEIFSIMVDGKPLKKQPEVVDTILRVPIDRELATGDSVEVEIVYSIDLPYSDYSRHRIFGVNDYGANISTCHFIVLPHGSGGWKTDETTELGDNEVSESSLYSFSVRAPVALDLVSSGIVTRVEDHDNSTRIWHLVGAPVRDFSILLLKNYYRKTSEVDGILLKVYTIADSEESKRALLLAEQSMQFFQASFGDYPYRELSIVETDTSAGGMEYPGLFLLSRNCFYYQSPHLEHYLTHEMAHQWWYGMVGSDQLREPWVDESLAQYSSYLFVRNFSGQASADAAFQTWFVQPFSESGDGPVDRPVSYYDNLTYRGLVYGKGAMFFGVVENKVSETVFFDSLREYFKKYKYGIADSFSFLEVAKVTSGQDLEPEYREWIVGTGR